jgi:hypothetical protein
VKLSIVVAAALTLASAGAAFAQSSQDKSSLNTSGPLPAQSPLTSGQGALLPQSPLSNRDSLSSAVPGLGTTNPLGTPPRPTSPLLPPSRLTTGPKPKLDWDPSSRTYPTQPTAEQAPHVDITAPMSRRGTNCGGTVSSGGFSC